MFFNRNNLMTLLNATLPRFDLLPKVENPSGRVTKKVKEYARNNQKLSAALSEIWNGKPSIAVPALLSFAIHKRKRPFLKPEQVRFAIEQALVDAGIIVSRELIVGTPIATVRNGGGANRVVLSLKEASPLRQKEKPLSVSKRVRDQRVQ